MRMWRNLAMCLGIIFAFGGCSQDDNSSAMRAQREAQISMEWAQKAAEQADRAELWAHQSRSIYSRVVEDYQRQQASLVICQQTCPKAVTPKVPVPKILTDSAKGQIVIQYQTTTTTTQPPRPCCSGAYYRDYYGRDYYFDGQTWHQ